MAEFARRVRVTYEVVTPESAARGDVAESGFEDELGVPCYGPYSAVRLLDDEGALDPSSGAFDPKAWYGTPDPIRNHRSGDETWRYFHPGGFPEQELREIFDAVRAISRGVPLDDAIAEGPEEAGRRIADECGNEADVACAPAP